MKNYKYLRIIMIFNFKLKFFYDSYNNKINKRYNMIIVNIVVYYNSRCILVYFDWYSGIYLG